MNKRSRVSSSSSSDSTSGHSPTANSLDNQSTNAEEHSSKYFHFSSECRRWRMKCSLPPHSEVLSFPTIQEFEIHYHKAHANRCSECKKNFPSELFLDLHISENHDPLNASRRAHGEKTVRMHAICFGSYSSLISIDVLWKTVRNFVQRQINAECT